MKTPQEIPHWIVNYNDLNYGSSAGKAVRWLMTELIKTREEYASQFKPSTKIDIPELKDAIEYLQSFGGGHEGFIKNEHGQYIYKAGPHGINLPHILNDYVESILLKHQ
jgi:hypothetical protein